MVAYLALRNLLLQRKRYALMAAAVLLGFALVTLLTASARGAMDTVQTKAARYFSGHVSITGFLEGRQQIEQPGPVVQQLVNSDLPYRTVAPRTVYYRQDSRLFFGGQSIRQRRLVGADFDLERQELGTLDFSAGGIDRMQGEEGEHGVLISEVAANLLGAQLGDDVQLFLTTDDGQPNTATLVVHGIFRETGIFGYVTYMRSADLKRLLQRPPDAATDIAVYVRPGTDIPAAAGAVRRRLDTDFRVFPPVLRRGEFSSVVDRSVEEETLAVVSVDAQLAEIRDLVDAFLMVSNFVVALFMIIVMFGILNTYRVLLHQRTREIGTMRALGMSRGGVKLVFLLEAAALAVIASLIGFLLGAVITFLVGLIDFGTGPAVAMFTERGRLQFTIRVQAVAVNLGLMVAAVLFAAWGPAHRASRLDPVEALRKNT